MKITFSSPDRTVRFVEILLPQKFATLFSASIKCENNFARRRIRSCSSQQNTNEMNSTGGQNRNISFHDFRDLFSIEAGARLCDSTCNRIIVDRFDFGIELNFRQTFSIYCLRVSFRVFFLFSSSVGQTTDAATACRLNPPRRHYFRLCFGISHDTMFALFRFVTRVFELKLEMNGRKTFSFWLSRLSFDIHRSSSIP